MVIYVIAALDYQSRKSKMLKMNIVCKGILTLVLFMVIELAHAAPGDDEAVAKAKTDYAQAMQGHDVGLQNAMKIQLSVQLAKSKERAGKEKATNGATEYK